jgi:hypothetical protein
MSNGSAETPLDVVVRFSTSNSDLVIAIPNPSSTSALSLKQQIRSQLEGAAASARLRLIHAGKVLQDNVALSKGLNVTIPPPPSTSEGAGKSEKAKGKQPVRDASGPPPAARVYIHCSIGDALTSSELASEIKAAEDADKALISKTSSLNTTPGTQQDGAATSTTTPAPRGFDRLLSTGFTPAEVAALRTQFLAIQAHTNTPDTMPSGPELLALEEQWLDNTHSTTSGADGMETGGFGGEEAGGLEDMLWGNLIGFFWPIGAMCWLMREEGVWSRRRQIAVISGFLVNLTFGFLRVMN